MKDIIITKLSATFYTFINQFQLVFWGAFLVVQTVKNLPAV